MPVDAGVERLACGWRAGAHERFDERLYGLGDRPSLGVWAS